MDGIDVFCENVNIRNCLHKKLLTFDDSTTPYRYLILVLARQPFVSICETLKTISHVQFVVTKHGWAYLSDSR